MALPPGHHSLQLGVVDEDLHMGVLRIEGGEVVAADIAVEVVLRPHDWKAGFGVLPELRALLRGEHGEVRCIRKGYAVHGPVMRFRAASP
ncbi:MAG TPA: hypothetical protein VGV93_13820 [Acidimicrobiales bacterium]|nr:hypothetical protein [Acidimicrobiales bacterium]